MSMVQCLAPQLHWIKKVRLLPGRQSELKPAYSNLHSLVLIRVLGKEMHAQAWVTGSRLFTGGAKVSCKLVTAAPGTAAQLQSFTAGTLGARQPEST